MAIAGWPLGLVWGDPARCLSAAYYIVAFPLTVWRFRAKGWEDGGWGIWSVCDFQAVDMDTNYIGGEKTGAY
jgi:hypothetical protein